MRSPFLFGLSFLAVALAAAGCGETFVASGGGGEGGTGGSGAGAGAGTTMTSQGGGDTTTSQGGGDGGGPLCTTEKDDDCTLCLLDVCELEACKCLGNMPCVDLGECVAKAGGDPSFAAIQYCWQQYKSGIALLGNLQTCGAQRCGACGFDEVPDCLACQYKHCPDEMNECLGDYECSALVDCAAKCGGEGGCLSACGTQWAQGVPLAQAIQKCSEEPCVNVCP